MWQLERPQVFSTMYTTRKPPPPTAILCTCSPTCAFQCLTLHPSLWNSSLRNFVPFFFFSWLPGTVGFWLCYPEYLPSLLASHLLRIGSVGFLSPEPTPYKKMVGAARIGAESSKMWLEHTVQLGFDPLETVAEVAGKSTNFITIQHTSLYLS